VHRLALALLAVLLAGSAPPPKTALLTRVRAESGRVVFSFRTAPGRVTARYVPTSQLAEDPSGKPVRVAGSAALVVRFTPASGVDQSGGTFTLVYRGPKRLQPAARGPVQEVVRTGDFEAVLSWAIGLDTRRPFHVARAGANVVVTVG